MKRKIAYVMSLVTLCFTILILLAQSVMVEAITFDDINITQTISTLNAEANNKAIVGVGFTSNTEKEKIGDRYYYRILSSRTSIYVPVFIINPSATVYKVSYETTDYTALAGTDYTAVSGDIYIRTGTNAKLYGTCTTSTGSLSYYYSYVTINASKSLFRIDNDFYENQNYEDKNISVEDISYGNEFFFTITDVVAISGTGDCKISEALDTVAVQLPGTINDNYQRYLNGDYSDYNSKLKNTDEIKIGGITMYTNVTYRSLGYYFDYTDVTVGDVDGLDDDSDKEKYANLSKVGDYSISGNPYIDAGIANLFINYSGKYKMKDNVSDDAWNRIKAFDTANTKIFDVTSKSTGSNESVTSSSSESGGNPIYLTTDPAHDSTKYIQVNAAKASKIRLEYTANTFWHNVSLWDQSIHLKVGDVKAPTVVSVSLDTSKITSTNHKVYYKIRLSEPVYAPTNAGFLAGVNGNMTPDSGYELRFKYYGGSLTNTLIFEADLDEYNGTGKYLIKSIEPLGVANINTTNSDYFSRYSFTETVGTDTVRYSLFDVRDLSPHQNSLGSDKYGVLEGFGKVTCSIDTRIPSISVSHSTDIAKTVTTKFSLEDCTTGYLYYLFNDSADDTDIDWSAAAKFYYDAGDTSEFSKQIVTSGYDGIKYIHVKAINSFGIESDPDEVYYGANNRLQKYEFDSSGPTVAIEEDAANTLKVRKFTVSATDLPSECKSGIKAIYIKVYDADGNEVISTLSSTKETYSFTLYASGTDANSLQLADGDRGTFTIIYYAIDNLENKSEEYKLKVQFDTNDYFEGNITAEDADTIINDDYARELVLVAKKDENQSTEDTTYFMVPKTTVSFMDPSGTLADSNCETISDFTITDSNNQSYSMADFTLTDGSYVNDYYKITIENNSATNADNRQFIIEFNGLSTGDLKYGYFDINLATSQGRSFIYRIYIGTNTEATTNIETINNTNIILNNVVKLPTEYSTLYYLSETDNVFSVNTRKYHLTATTPNPVFSSAIFAREYIYAMEFNDIAAIALTADQATLLAADNGGYIKATGETTIPAAGQIWIRYKISSWTASSTSSAWRYYFYSENGDSTKVNTGAFSSNLVTAMNTVTDTICSTLYTDYLVEDVDSYGNPKESATATFADSFTIEVSLSGTKFSNPASYAGDSAIYINSIKLDNDNEYKLAKNYYLSIDADTRLFFYDGTDYYSINSDYDGYNVYDALKGVTEIEDTDIDSKIIYLYEFSGAGSNCVALYLDVVAPTVTVAITDVNNQLGNKTISSDSKNVIITGSKVSLLQLSDVDSYSYIVIRTYIKANVGNFISLYRYDEISANKPSLTEGNYIVSVFDRSGNSYSFYVFVTEGELKVTQTVTENEYFKINCNRSSEQISLYEVYFNGSLVTSSYDLTKRYVSSGLYRIYVRDIYGNIYDNYYEFERDYPTVTWSYYIDGSYTTYKEATGICPMKLTGTGDGEYTIITNTSLSFVYSSSCTISFEVEPSTYTISETTNKVIIGSNGEATAFVLRVAYSNLPSVYTRYICIVDTSAPLIKAKCTYSLFDIDTDEINLIDEDGNLQTPVSFWYESLDTSDLNHSIEDGTVEYTDKFNTTITDEYTIYSISVYLDGVLIKSLSNVSNPSFDTEGYGSFTIVATDIYGNRSEFNFENRSTSQFEYSIDGKTIALAQDLTGNFNETTKEYEAINYGHESAVMTINQSGFFRVILRHGENVEYAVFKFSGNTILQYKFELITSGDETEDTSDDITYLGKTYVKTYTLQNGSSETITIGNLSFSAKYNSILDPTYSTNSIELIFNPIDDTEYTVDLRYDTEFDNPSYVKFGLSTYSSTVSFYDLDGKQVGVSTVDQVKISEVFKVVSDSDADIVVLYDAAGHFIYNQNIYEEGKYYYNEGAYLVTVTNKYGNVSTYSVIYYESFLVAVHVEYDDSTSFSLNNPTDAYSNYKIRVILYDECTISVTKDGVEYTPEITLANDVYSFELELEGEYKISLVNIYNNDFAFNAHIHNEKIVEDNLLSGYNENALRKNQGYTNQALTINYDVANTYSYISVTYNDKVNVLKDVVTGAGITLDSSILAGYVGSLGDGEYKVLVRDIYGNSHIDNIYYRGTETLSLARKIRTNVENESYSIQKACEIGFWSNGSLIFETDARVYEFMIDGKNIYLPYKLNYEGTENDGAYIYHISYIDEYGFSYEFDGHLVRTTINLEVSKSAKAEEIDGVMTTRYPFSMVYDSIISSCSYVKDSITYSYSGETIEEDGVYRFAATDLAGNNTSYTIVKDSIVEFTFKNSASAKEVIFGETITILRMNFSSVNGDSSYIYAAYKDGSPIKDFGDSYNEAGTYEFLIRDAIGNETYFKFRMINDIVGSFEYETPYSYLVTSVIYYTSLIPEISYMEYVDQFANYSKMSFKEDGFYEITTQSKDTGNIIKLSFEINTSEPVATLTGVANGGSTINDVNLKNLKSGDVVEVYKDSKLIKTYYISMDGEDITDIKDGGKYKIVITNAAGISKTFEFTRKHTANVAGSALVVIGSVVVVGLIFFGILQHNKKKTDI